MNLNLGVLSLEQATSQEFWDSIYKEYFMSHRNFQDLTYSMWENEANKYMLTKHGVGIDDIPDMLWHDWFMDDIDYEEAVDMAIQKVNEEGF